MVNDGCKLPENESRYNINWERLIFEFGTKKTAELFVKKVKEEVICKEDSSNFRSIGNVSIASHPYDKIYVKIWVSGIIDHGKWYKEQNRVENWVLNPTKYFPQTRYLRVPEITKENVEFQFDVDEF